MLYAINQKLFAVNKTYSVSRYNFNRISLKTFFTNFWKSFFLNMLCNWFLISHDYSVLILLKNWLKTRKVFVHSKKGTSEVCYTKYSYGYSSTWMIEIWGGSTNGMIMIIDTWWINCSCHYFKSYHMLDMVFERKIFWNHRFHWKLSYTSKDKVVHEAYKPKISHDSDKKGEKPDL